MSTGDKIKHYRKLRGLYQGELAEKVGLTEGAIRHYESGARTPKPSQINDIAKALEVSPLALKDFGMENAKDLLALMLQLEDEYRIVPTEDGVSIAIDPKAPAAPKVAQMLKVWSEKRAELASGEISEEEYLEWKARF
ncbi:helix-turn-helix domain-containing protein [Lancefieldella parvula]|uniref:helix-turn-helix domain-containing protein n=1 Tax=Lancefieldella parvula TaxID=1382 RepID=UPI002889D9DF|nr:helix-turn-helix transcriptional regulator [Lancefieldella parvula]